MSPSPKPVEPIMEKTNEKIPKTFPYLDIVITQDIGVSTWDAIDNMLEEELQGASEEEICVIVPKKVINKNTC